MAGNNDEKIVRRPQLDRLTKSLDARNSIIIQNVHDELISAVEDVEKKLFSGDYNDLTNKPEIPSIEGLATEEDIIELEEDILSMEGMIDETYPNLITQDKTILGAINELAGMLNGLTLMPITQEAYDTLAEKNPNVLYIITE